MGVALTPQSPACGRARRIRLRHPALPRPDPVYGEQPVLFVSLYPGAMLSVDAIEKHVRVSVSKYKLPAEITVLDDLPKNLIGKIDKPRLTPVTFESRPELDAAATPAVSSLT